MSIQRIYLTRISGYTEKKFHQQIIEQNLFKISDILNFKYIFNLQNILITVVKRFGTVPYTYFFCNNIYI